MKNCKTTIIIILFLLSFLVYPPPFTPVATATPDPDPSLVGTVTSSGALMMAFMRKAFWANGRFWVFYSNGTNAVYRSSLDGVSWSEETVIGVADAGFDITVHFDGTYVHYVLDIDTNLKFRRGIPNSDGTITWSVDEQTIFAVDGNYDCESICVDSDGYPWITYRQYVGTWTAYVTKSQYNNGLWEHATDFPISLGGECYPAIVALTNQKMYLVYGYAGGSTLRGRLWNGTGLEPEETASTSVCYTSVEFSATSKSDDVYAVFVYAETTPYKIFFINRTYGVGWSGEVEVQSLVQTVAGELSYPFISIDGDGTLYCFWASSPTDSYIYYKKCVDGVWDTDPTTWINDMQGIQSLETGGDLDESFYGVYWKSQSFISLIDDKIDRIEIRGKRGAGTTSVPINVDIYEADVEGKPTGSSLGSGTIPSFTTTTYAWRVCTFATPVSVNASVRYCLVVSAPTGNATEYYKWYVDSTSPPYENGNWSYSDDGGSSWTADVSKDALFRVRFQSSLYSAGYPSTMATFYGAYGGYIGLLYLTRQVSPYNVKFAFLSGLSPYTPVTSYPLDVYPPTYSNVGTNTTKAGSPCLFYTKWADETGLASTGGFIFGTNNTGSWQNETWTAFTTNPDWSNKTKTLNSTVGVKIAWQVWANDTSNNWATTGTQYLTTTLIDTVTISIIKPQNITYVQPTIPVEITASGGSIDKIWYNCKNGTEWIYPSNLTYTTPPSSITGFINGTYTFYAWANNTDGDLDSKTVVFSVLTLPPIGVVVDTSTSTRATEVTFQNKILYDGTYWWGFYWNGSDVVYKHSSDGETWSDASVFWSYLGFFDGVIDVVLDGNVIYAASSYGGSVYFRNATISGSTLTLGSVVTVYTDPSYRIRSTSITKATNGYLWIVFHIAGVGPAGRVWSSVDEGNTWVLNHTWSSSAGISYYDACTIVKPLSDGKILLVSSGGDGVLYYNIWNNGWETRTSLGITLKDTGATYDVVSLAVDSNFNAHLAAIKSDGKLVYRKYNGTAWEPTVTVDTDTLCRSPSIYVTSSEIVSIVYTKGNSLYAAYKLENVWNINIIGTYSSPKYITTSPQNLPKIPLMFTDGEESPYNVTFAILSYFDLNLRIKDANDNIVKGATVYVGVVWKTSDLNGWANFTFIQNAVVDVKVKYQDVWVNGIFSIIMDDNKTIDVTCNIYSLTVKVQTLIGDVPDCPLNLYRDGTLLNGMYGLPLYPKTNSSGYYIWQQLAIQDGSYIIKSPWIGVPDVSTSLTENKLLTITVAPVAPLPTPPAPPLPPYTLPTPEQIIETFRKVPILILVPMAIMIVVYAVVARRKKK